MFTLRTMCSFCQPSRCFSVRSSLRQGANTDHRRDRAAGEHPGQVSRGRSLRLRLCHAVRVEGGAMDKQTILVAHYKPRRRAPRSTTT